MLELDPRPDASVISGQQSYPDQEQSASIVTMSVAEVKHFLTLREEVGLGDKSLAESARRRQYGGSWRAFLFPTEKLPD